MAEDPTSHPSALEDQGHAVGIAGQLFCAAIETLQAVDTEDKILGLLSGAARNRLKRAIESLTLWGTDHKVEEGELDVKFQQFHEPQRLTIRALRLVTQLAVLRMQA
jgi:hypothetical protein